MMGRRITAFLSVHDLTQNGEFANVVGIMIRHDQVNEMLQRRIQDWKGMAHIRPTAGALAAGWNEPHW